MDEMLNTILAILTEIRDQNAELKKRVSQLESDTLLSPRDAAAFLGCSTHTLRNRCRRGLLQQKFIGGRKGYLLSDLTKIQ